MTDREPLTEEQRDILAVLDAEDQEDLDLCDFEVWQVEVAGCEYTVLHGFPGDNPLGVFVTPDEWIEFGEAREPESTHEAFAAFYAWYLSQSQQMCDYAFIPPLPRTALT